MTLTEKQIDQALQMHEAGITWDIIAAYFGVTKEKLLQLRKHYGKQIRHKATHLLRHRQKRTRSIQ